ncbi:MAG: hypothetical protein A3B23_03640 [Candidatus Colwellbacteria bacterium RIFCSPLOWO2_01_FULL_48_10]|uniref:30S ribosomal protein S21 n=2 Tax=Bacteria candidate phyla TaxID=1783234 RepID=A0A1F5P129_9BACT|nr:MAG: hypothetical protein A2846_01110 [Candidatus Doudnabacteria bacterium RIFCSPHIGHO2_01_FULL_49_9]OGY59773.1 MAG: hypothetical protein A3B23_03640 [Candidatus Colwellbacteria bacterium RIFCSPLOWO2_01_FULL_48_10]
MGVIVKKKEGESPNSMVYRFVKKVQQSGVLREVKGRRFTKRGVNKNKRRLSAIHRATKRAELEKTRKMGLAER